MENFVLPQAVLPFTILDEIFDSGVVLFDFFLVLVFKGSAKFEFFLADFLLNFLKFASVFVKQLLCLFFLASSEISLKVF